MAESDTVISTETGTPAPVVPSAPSVLLFQALSFGTEESLKQILETDTKFINSVGPQGQTPLQTAAYSGRSNVVKLLLKYNADPNVRGAKGRTAMHLALQTGDITTIHVLFEHESDVSAVDDDGRGCMHYAALSPSPSAVYYLQYVADLTLLCLDKHGSTPLHIAARHPSYSETMKYLLRQNVYDVAARDVTGATALHYAASAGNRLNCWLLICAAKDRMALLEAEDKNNHTAVGLARRSNRRRNHQLPQDLMLWAKWGKMHAHFHWALHFFFPLVTLSSVLFAFTHLPETPALLVALCCPVLFLYLFRRLHRTSHVSRLASPLNFGLFMAGMLHTIMCFSAKLMPFYWHTEPKWTLVCCAVIATVIWSIWSMWRADPGTCEESVLGKNGDALDIDDVAEDDTQGENGLLFCPHCTIVCPPRTKHCRICEHCVEQFDHHCLWLHRCVGYLNLRLFVLTLFTTSLCTMLFARASWRYIRLNNYELSNLYQVFTLFVHKEPWVSWLMVANVLTGFYIAVVLVEKLYTISLGCTAYFDSLGYRYSGFGASAPSSERKEYHLPWRQRVRNVLNFLLTTPKKVHRKPVTVA